MQVRVAVVGYGHVGKYAVQAVCAAPDLTLAGIVRRKGGPPVAQAKVVMRMEELGQVDVALLCVPTRKVQEVALPYLQKGISTVDSFDLHAQVPALRAALDAVAKPSGATAILSAGWDPGSDSVVRALMEACAPKGITHTNFGPGMSMGHTVAAKSKPGVADAMSMTIPMGAGLHRRLVYVQLEAGASLEDVRAEIHRDPYFAADETQVIAVDDIEGYIDAGHGVDMVRKGVSGETHNQQFAYQMRINNPALTGQVMAACARAAMRQPAGAYTMIELPVVDLLPGERAGWVARLV